MWDGNRFTVAILPRPVGLVDTAMPRLVIANQPAPCLLFAQRLPLTAAVTVIIDSAVVADNGEGDDEEGGGGIFVVPAATAAAAAWFVCWCASYLTQVCYLERERGRQKPRWKGA